MSTKNIHHQASTLYHDFTTDPPPAAERGGYGPTTDIPGPQDHVGTMTRAIMEEFQTLRQEMSIRERKRDEKMETTIQELRAEHRKQFEGILRMMGDIIHEQKQRKEAPTTYAAAAASNYTQTASNTTNGAKPKQKAPPPQARIPPTANPRDETDIKVWIRGPEAIERLRTVSSGDLVKSINEKAETDGNTGRAAAARQIRNGNVVVATASIKDKKALMEQTGWLRAIDTEAQIASQRYLVLIHGVRRKAINTKSPDTYITKLEIDNEPVLLGTKISRITWAKHKIPQGQEYASLVASFECPRAANRAISRGMISEHRVQICELYDVNCKTRQCFNCQKYGHLSTGCIRPTKCGHCAGHHTTSSCDQKEGEPRCAACGEDGHPSWAKSCVLQKKEEERTRGARYNRQTLYAEPPLEETTTPTQEMRGSSGGESQSQNTNNSPSQNTNSSLTEFIMVPPKKRGRPRTKSPTKRQAIEPVRKQLCSQETAHEDEEGIPDEEMEEAGDQEEHISPEDLLRITSTGRTSRLTLKAAQGKVQGTISAASKRPITSRLHGNEGRVLKPISGNSKPHTRLTSSQSSKDSDIALC